MKILFICSSNKDRSPALQKYFSENYPAHEFKSAGVNKYFTGKHGTHYLTKEDIEWANAIVCAERIHLDILMRDFDINQNAYSAFYPFTISKVGEPVKFGIVLTEREFKEENKKEYLQTAEQQLKSRLFHLL